MKQSRLNALAHLKNQVENLASPEQAIAMDLLNLLTHAIDYKTGENHPETIADPKSESDHQLLHHLIQLTDEMEALKRLGLNITSSLDLRHVLDAVAAEALVLLKNVRSVNIFLANANGKLSFAAAISSNGILSKPYAEPRIDGITYAAARTGEKIIVTDMQDHHLYETAPKEWTGSIVSIPLKIGKRLVGVMNVSRSQVGEFNKGNLRTLSLLASQAAIAIENARLHEMVLSQAHSDILTGLPNRRALDERLETETHRAERTHQPFSVIMMDLDGFKEINDTYGHAAGDQILRELFSLLASSIRVTDFLARYGGDELTLILPETDQEATKMVVKKLQETLINNPVLLPNEKLSYIGVSGGIALYPYHARTASNLLRAADEALYRAKQTKRGHFLLAQGFTGA